MRRDVVQKPCRGPTFVGPDLEQVAGAIGETAEMFHETRDVSCEIIRFVELEHLVHNVHHPIARGSDHSRLTREPLSYVRYGTPVPISKTQSSLGMPLDFIERPYGRLTNR